jgi:SAM-dependent methyltransferase
MCARERPSAAAAPIDSSPHVIRAKDRWSDSTEYERYVGRWSRLVAREFLSWIAVPWRQRWLDVGCGTGALSQTILARCQPELLVGVDRSIAYAASAARATADAPARFAGANATALPVAGGGFDAAVSALLINFVSDPTAALAEMMRAVRPGGTVAIYVWDYAGRMEMIRHFWDAAIAIDPEARAADEARRFPICQPDALESIAIAAGLGEVSCCAIDVPTEFKDFDDYWTPFLSGEGPAPGYCASLDETRRARLREALLARLPILPDGTISLIARAWATRGRRPVD